MKIIIAICIQAAAFLVHAEGSGPLAGFGSSGGFLPRSDSTKDLPHMLNAWINDGAFHQLVDKADRIVVRKGGHDCCNANIDEQEILIAITNRIDIVQFNAHIEFVSPQKVGMNCMCCGFPGIDWFIGTNRIALTSVQHGKALRWKFFPSDIAFTARSSEWLKDWLLDHSTKGTFREYEEWKAKQMDTPSPRELEAKALIDIGKELLENDQLEQALLVGFLRATLTHSDTQHYPEAAFHAGEILETLGRQQEAIRLYRRLMTQYPENAFGKQAAERLQLIEKKNSQPRVAPDRH